MTLVRIPALHDSARRGLAVLAHLQYATAEQLYAWSAFDDRSSVTRLLQRLQRDALVEVYAALRPRVYSLSAAGARALGVTLRSQRPAIGVIQRHCHKNAAELALREQDPAAVLQSRAHALRFGLRPAIGEYLVSLQDHDALLLVDDYHMPSARIKSAFHRIHRPHPQYYRIDANHPPQSWAQACRAIVVCCTDSIHLERHARYITTYTLPAITLPIEPLWRVH